MRLAPAVCVSIFPVLSTGFLTVAEIPDPPGNVTLEELEAQELEAEAQAAAEWAELLRVVEVLQRGDRQQKLSLFEAGEGESALVYLEEPPAGDERLTRAVVSDLRDWFRTESDVLVMDLAARDLAYWGDEAARPIFADLSTHRAPSLRFRAIAYALELDEDEELELVERMWSVEAVPWLQAELLRARMELWSWPTLEECAPLLDTGDPDAVAAALECLASLPEPEAGVLLAGAAGASTGSTRRLALDALVEWLGDNPPAPEVGSVVRDLWHAGAFPAQRERLLEALLGAIPEEAEALAPDLAWDEDEDVATRAIRILARPTLVDGPELLLARARSGAPALRAAAIDALDGIVLADGVTELLVSSLSAGEPPEVRRAAAYVLGGRGSLPFISPSPTEPAWAARFEFAGLLQTLAGSDPDVTVRLTASESPLVAMETEEVVTYGTPCHMSVDILTDDGPSFVVRRPDEGASARCYPLPGVEPDPEESPRVAAGKIGQREDRFDDGVESWLLLDFDLQTCWLRETQVERIDPLTDPLPAGSVAPGSTYRRGGWDVDLPLELANTPWFAHLETAGIVKRFDRGRTVTGVAVTQPLSPSQRTALLTQDEWASTPLEAILRLAIKQ